MNPLLVSILVIGSFILGLAILSDAYQIGDDAYYCDAGEISYVDNNDRWACLNPDLVYCSIGGNCSFDYLNVSSLNVTNFHVINTTISNFNVTGDVYGFSFWTNGTNIDDIYYNVAGDTLEGTMNTNGQILLFNNSAEIKGVKEGVMIYDADTGGRIIVKQRGIEYQIPNSQYWHNFTGNITANDGICFYNHTAGVLKCFDSWEKVQGWNNTDIKTKRLNITGNISLLNYFTIQTKKNNPSGSDDLFFSTPNAQTHGFRFNGTIGINTDPTRGISSNPVALKIYPPYNKTSNVVLLIGGNAKQAIVSSAFYNGIQSSGDMHYLAGGRIGKMSSSTQEKWVALNGQISLSQITVPTNRRISLVGSEFDGGPIGINLIVNESSNVSTIGARYIATNSNLFGSNYPGGFNFISGAFFRPSISAQLKADAREYTESAIWVDYDGIISDDSKLIFGGDLIDEYSIPFIDNNYMIWDSSESSLDTYIDGNKRIALNESTMTITTQGIVTQKFINARALMIRDSVGNSNDNYPSVLIQNSRINANSNRSALATIVSKDAGGGGNQYGGNIEAWIEGEVIGPSWFFRFFNNTPNEPTNLVSFMDRHGNFRTKGDITLYGNKNFINATVGDLFIDSYSQLNLQGSDTHIKAEDTIDISASSTVDINAPDGIDLNNNTDITGNLDVTGNITGNFLHFEGGFYNGSGARFPFAVQDKYYLFPMTETHTEGFTANANGSFTCYHSGEYLIFYKASGRGTANQIYETAIGINATPINYSQSFIRVGNSNNIVQMSGQHTVNLNRGDRVSAMIKQNTGTGTGYVYIASIEGVRIGEIE